MDFEILESVKNVLSDYEGYQTTLRKIYDDTFNFISQELGMNNA